MAIPTLYIKVMKGKKTTYQEYNPNVPCPMLEDKQVLTLMSTLVVALLMNYENHFPEHSRLGRQLNKVKEAVIDLAALNKEPLDDTFIQAGVRAWEASIESVVEFLSRGVEDDKLQETIQQVETSGIETVVV